MQLFKTSLYTAFYTSIRIASGFVASKFVALYVGPSGISLLGAYTNFISIVQSMGTGSITTGVVKYIAEYNENENESKNIIISSSKIIFYCSVTIGIVIILFNEYFSRLIIGNDILKNPIYFIGFTLIFFSLNNIFISIINGKKEIAILTKLNIISSISGMLLTVILVFFFKLTGAIYSFLISQLIVFFFTYYIVRYKKKWFYFKYIFLKFDNKIGKKLFNYTIMGIASAVSLPITQIVIRNIIIFKFGIDYSGYWQGMLRISDGYLLVISITMSTYFLPQLSSLTEIKDIRNEILSGFKMIIPFVILSTIFIYFFRFQIIHLLFTNKFIKMENLFFFQFLGDIFKVAAWIVSYIVLAKSMTKLFIFSEILFSFTYIILTKILISKFQLEGVTIAYAINAFLNLIFMSYKLRNFLFINRKVYI